MKEEHKRENEKFFDRVLSTLNEGGVYGWVSQQEFMTKKANKLECTERAYNELRKIVTDDFLLKTFVVV